tara:strand:- start:9899 stop:11440 length:1542 start_codon:yes stop_codon:yes gene_type:complete
MHFTITTPLYYVNDKPHLGSTYTTIACDALARFQRLNNKKVLFITGVDEHGQKIERTAKANSIEPKQHCDKISKVYKKLWTEWDISADRYVRTTSIRHTHLVHKFFKRVQASGDIKVGRQNGWYCVGCEEYKDVPNSINSPVCEIHQKELEWRDEENLFFCLSKYQTKIEELVNSESFIYPRSRQREIINFVSNGLKDFSISRVNVDWGISVPGYPGHTFYVWFDALLGYLSGTLEGSNDIDLDELVEFGWPASIHVIGKDILRFHAVYWPAMLLSAGIELPKKVFGHGFLTREGQKMGKTLGNVLDPHKLLKLYGTDAVRWYLLRDIEFGQDGDFKQQRFIDIVNNDLSNTIGNLLNRSVTMARNWFDNKVPAPDININSKYLENYSIRTIINYKNCLNQLDFKGASEYLLELAICSNCYLNDKEPWKNIKDKKNISSVATVLYSVLETTRIIGILINPLTPDLSNRIIKQLGYNIPISSWQGELEWGRLNSGTLLPEPIPVMNRLEYNDEL